MEIDIRTVILIIGISHLMQTLVFYHQYKSNKNLEGPGWWLLWSAAEAAGFALILLRNIPSLAPTIIIFQNVVLLSGVIFIYIGVMRFFDKKVNFKLIIFILTCFLSLHFIFIFVENDMVVRTINLNAFLSMMGFLTAAGIYKNKTRSIALTANFNAALFLVHGTLFAYRTVMIIRGAPITDLYSHSLFNLLQYFDALILGLLWTFGFIMMLNQRLNSEISETRAHFEQIFNTSPDAAVITRLRDGMVIDCNESFTKIFGYSKEIFIGKSFFDSEIWGNPEDKLEISRMIDHTGFCENHETQFQRKNGHVITGLISTKTLILNGIPHAISITRDVTEQKQAEAALLDKQQIIEGIINSIPASVFWKDLNLVFLGCNAAFARDAGFSDPKEIIGKDDYHMVWRDQAELYRSDDQHIIKSGCSKLNIEEPQTGSDGNTITLLTSKIPLLDCYGNVSGVLGTYLDITDRKQAEQQIINAKGKLEESEKQFRQLFEHMEQGFALHEMIYDDQENPLDYRFIMMNSAFERLTGTRAGDLIGKTVKEALPNTEPIWIENYGKVAKSGVPVHFASYSQEFDKYYDIVAYSPKKDFFAVVFTDVTIKANYEKELLAAKEKAEENDRLKTAFLHNMSHEIRTPMNAIVGFSELLLDEFDNKQKLEQYTRIICQRATDLLVIINDILDIAQIESGQMAVNKEKCNLFDLFEELELFFSEHQKKIKKQHITFSLRARCGPLANVIVTDKAKLKQIFINLISNAFKFTESGSIEGGCKFENGNLLFYVTDTGIGIPVDKQNLIFERFAQVEHENDKFYGGTGLGLPIVKGLVNILGGEVFLESKLGEGSTFSFSFPYGSSQAAPADAVIQKELKKYHFPNKIILIVEDDLLSAEFLKVVLANAGFQILHAENGRDAIQIAQTEPIDLVLMDIRLPDIDGYAAIRQIKHLKPHLKIISQTAFAMQSDKQKALDAGFIDYISKPINKDLLLSMISQHLID